MCHAMRPASGDELAERLFNGTIQALELFSVYLGAELGLYRLLVDQGPATPDELSARAGIAPRYAREWLEQQAVAGLVAVDDASLPADARRYALPPEHANVLVHEEDAAHLAPLAQMVAGIGGVLDRVLAAYRTGGGVGYEHYGAAFRRGQSGINRPAFLSDLASRWIPSIPDLHDRLAHSPTRIAEVAAAPAGRRSPSRAPFHRRRSSGSTPTPRRLPTPGPTAPRTGSRCGSRPVTRWPWATRGRSTWCSSWRRFTTCRGRARC